MISNGFPAGPGSSASEEQGRSAAAAAVAGPSLDATFTGASCGALIACALAAGVEVSQFIAFAYSMTDLARSRFMGPAGHMSFIVAKVSTSNCNCSSSSKGFDLSCSPREHAVLSVEAASTAEVRCTSRMSSCTP